MTYVLSPALKAVLRELREFDDRKFYNVQDGGVSTDPDTLRGGPGPELTPRAGAAPRHEGKS